MWGLLSLDLNWGISCFWNPEHLGTNTSMKISASRSDIPLRDNLIIVISYEFHLSYLFRQIGKIIHATNFPSLIYSFLRQRGLNGQWWFGLSRAVEQHQLLLITKFENSLRQPIWPILARGSLSLAARHRSRCPIRIECQSDVTFSYEIWGWGFSVMPSLQFFCKTFFCQTIL